MRKISLKESLSYIKKHQAIIKERLVFVCIFLMIAIPLSIMFVQSYKQTRDLNERNIQEELQKAFSYFENGLITDLNQENRRSYKAYGILNSIAVIGGSGIQLSAFFVYPDSIGPFCEYDPNYRCTKGLIGHFQISHNGDLLTPFYPDTSTRIGKSIWDNPLFDSREERKKTRDQIQHLLDTLGIKNSLPKQATQMVDSTEAIDQLYEEIPNLAISARTETTSENEAISYIAETQKNDSTFQPELLTFSGANTNVEIENFKARAINDTIVFFRKIQIGQVPVIQGFAVDMFRYLNIMVQDKLKDIENSPYAVDVTMNGELIASVGVHRSSHTLKQVRHLEAPYNNIALYMYADKSVNFGSTVALISGIILLIVIAIALWTIYRFTQSKVALASKRQDFVSAITHELKTPLTAIKMYAELLQNSWVVSDEKRQKYYTQIASEADRLSRLIQNVLNLSKLDGNRWNVQLRRERPKAVLDDFVATYSKNVEKQGFELTVSSDTDANNISLLIDRDAIMQILMNLVDNSLKFSKKSDYKMINIELTIKGTDMYLAVRDFGPGIPPAEMKKVFQEFYRVENEMTRQTSGTGIGLSMVSKLCSLTNMKIELENANPGLRTKIHFPPLDL